MEYANKRCTLSNFKCSCHPSYLHTELYLCPSRYPSRSQQGYFTLFWLYLYPQAITPRLHLTVRFMFLFWRAHCWWLNVSKSSNFLLIMPIQPASQQSRYYSTWDGNESFFIASLTRLKLREMQLFSDNNRVESISSNKHLLTCHVRDGNQKFPSTSSHTLVHRRCAMPTGINK